MRNLARPTGILRVLALAFAAVPLSLAATWSVIAVDTRSGRIAVASATCVPAATFRKFPAPGVEGLKDIQAIVAPGRGIAAAQARLDVTLENQRLIYRELRKGTPPQRILNMLRTDPDLEQRQFAILDLAGRSARFTGRENPPAALVVAGWAAGSGIRFSIQGNSLASEAVVADSVAAFKAAAGTMTDRILAAMEAGDAAGGDRRCSCSTEPLPNGPCDRRTSLTAYLLEADPDDPSGQGFNDGRYRLFLNVNDRNIRSGESTNPVRTLRMRYERWKKLPEAASATEPEGAPE
jgi:uncharacterized Ntn-hydrolase superfamily protein